MRNSYGTFILHEMWDPEFRAFIKLFWPSAVIDRDLFWMVPSQVVLKYRPGLWNQMRAYLMRKLWGLSFGNPKNKSDLLHVILCVSSGSILQLPGWGREEGAKALQQPEETWKFGPRECQALPSHDDRSDLWTGERGFWGAKRDLFTHLFIPHLFIECLLCARHCSGPGGYSSEQKF